MTIDNDQRIFHLKLHEGLLLERVEIYVLRVPGGWLYTDTEDSNNSSACFVPYNPEFRFKAEE